MWSEREREEGGGGLGASKPRNAALSHGENAQALFRPRPPGGAGAPGPIGTAAFAASRASTSRPLADCRAGTPGRPPRVSLAPSDPGAPPDAASLAAQHTGILAPRFTR